MDLVKNIFSGGLGMGTGAISDTVKLVVIGGTVETARRVASSSWNSFVDSFFLTAHFTQMDSPYEWIMHWLSQQPAWGRSREFDITTRSVKKGSANAGDFGDDDEDQDEVALTHGRKKNMIAFMPAQDTTHTIYYRGHWLRITRSKRTTDWGTYQEVKISVVARNNTVIKQLVLEAKKMYEKDAEHRIHVFIPDQWGSWRWNGSRQKRPMESIVLEANVKDMIVADCKDFIASEDWYAERGIPYRRGYLLYGVPGSGKTSLIHALAGELGLDIYALSLAAKGMSDNTLTQLMGHLPTRCIVLLEDLDASFTHSTTRDKKSTGVPTVPTSSQSTESDGSSLTLSGLLNAIDGVTAPEGRILFATTNHIDRLDEALRRPGRMDVWINFKYATQWQAEGIFKRFFPCRPKIVTGSNTPMGSESSTAGSTSATALSAALSEGETTKKKKRASINAMPILEEDELVSLAKRFSLQIPEDEVSVAGLQGFLLKNKTRPRECVEEVGKWVVEERERREKLKKEKAEKEAKEKEEEEKKEKEEKEAKEKEKEKENAEDLAAARKAYRKAKKAAAAASSSATALPTPPADEPTVTLEKADSDSDDSDEDASTSSSSSEEDRKSKRKNRKEKWVAVKKESATTETGTDAAAPAAQETTTSSKAVEETAAEVEDLSSVDALVDAATTKSSSPPKDAPIEPAVAATA